jgi:hypothetical protein
MRHLYVVEKKDAENCAPDIKEKTERMLNKSYLQQWLNI